MHRPQLKCQQKTGRSWVADRKIIIIIFGIMKVMKKLNGKKIASPYYEKDRIFKFMLQLSSKFKILT